jgi:hypothetical protein
MTQGGHEHGDPHPCACCRVSVGFANRMTRLMQLELHDWRRLCGKAYLCGGEGEIRTHEALANPPVFKSDDDRHTYARMCPYRLPRYTAQDSGIPGFSWAAANRLQIRFTEYATYSPERSAEGPEDHPVVP